jgi:hypothetical protein
MSTQHDEQDRALATWLREVADTDAATGASAAVRDRLLDEARTLRAARRATLVKMYALAAGLIVATAMPVWQLSMRSTTEVTPLPAVAVSTGEVATRFFPLVYSDVPVTHGNIVRVEMSPSAVAALGVEPIAGSGRDVVLADVIVGEDGLARAVRFVRAPR